MYEAIDAAEARHQANMARTNQMQWSTNERVMNAIRAQASLGQYSLIWRYPISKETMGWLLSLGYTIEVQVCNHSAKLYKNIISWNK